MDYERYVIKGNGYYFGGVSYGASIWHESLQDAKIFNGMDEAEKWIKGIKGAELIQVKVTIESL